MGHSVVVNIFFLALTILLCECCTVYVLFFHLLIHCQVLVVFPVLSLMLAIMSGIKNKDGGRHCYLNSLLQCMSINDILYGDIQRHNVNHITPIGKYYENLKILLESLTCLTMNCKQISFRIFHM